MLDSIDRFVQKNIRRLLLGGSQHARAMVEELCHRFGAYACADSSGSFLSGVDLERPLEWGEGRSFFITLESKAALLKALRRTAPQAEGLIVAEADRLCAHVFDLLGSGPIPLGERIDWHVDFKTGHRWNPKTFYKRIRYAPYPGGYDIKVPWELSRCQHFLRLAQAFLLTGDEKYAREFAAQADHWIGQNPWPWGVNWASSMDVAIRAVNWLWAYRFFGDSESLSTGFKVRFFTSLSEQGRHIFRNLESKGIVRNNHYLADLVGLVHLGVLCPWLKEAKRWREFAVGELWREILAQVYPDGVSFEASVAYHRLSLEMVMVTVFLCRETGVEIPREVLERLEKMVEFVLIYTRPDGSVPKMGDEDNGRLLRLGVWEEPEKEWDDHRSLLALGGTLFGRADFSQAAGEKCWEAAWILSRPSPRLEAESVDSPGSRRFSDSGVYILRNQRAHMLVEAGRLGTGGLGGHNHYNPLGLELWMNGKVLFADPGTYTYSSDWQARELFRSVRSHNTVEAEEESTGKMAPMDLFRLRWGGTSREREWTSDGRTDCLCLERIEPEFNHLRKVCFDKEETRFEIDDELWGRKPRRYLIRFHLGFGIRAEKSSSGGILLAGEGLEKAVRMEWSVQGWSFQQEAGWLSDGYGRRGPGQILLFRSSAVIKVVWRCRIQ